MRRALIPRVGVLLYLLFAGISFAQERNVLPDTGNPSLRVAVDLVLLDASVTDEKGRSVRGLSAQDFKVYEDKVEQTIRHFTAEESPVSWGIVVDRSGSMTGMDDVYDAAVHMIRDGTSDDEMFVMTFSRSIDSLSDHTVDRRTLQDSLFGLHNKGATALWDAVDSALDYLKYGKHRKKALLVITDGSDNKSRLRFSSLLDRVRESDVIVYTVGINTPMGAFAKGGRSERDRLAELAEVTGGFAHFPGDMEKCRESMAEIMREVSEHYTIGYYPTNGANDGKWRKVRVTLNSQKSGARSPKYLARTRAGYFSGRSAAESELRK